ncbi:MAG: hypothetical protein KAT65_25575 [Methanophagales archaeon]|nr:hypothetical protein [Methanophagales archaeon]
MEKIRQELEMEARVNVEVVDEIELEPSEKLHSVVSNVKRDFKLMRYTKLGWERWKK